VWLARLRSVRRAKRWPAPASTRPRPAESSFVWHRGGAAAAGVAAVVAAAALAISRIPKAIGRMLVLQSGRVSQA
jgi:hypothetical protein